MFNFLKAKPAVALLMEDHDKVKDLFDQFEKARVGLRSARSCDGQGIARRLTFKPAGHEQRSGAVNSADDPWRIGDVTLRPGQGHQVGRIVGRPFEGLKTRRCLMVR